MEPLKIKVKLTKTQRCIKRGKSYLSPVQKVIVEECIDKGSGGLSLPMGSGKTLISIVVSLIQSEKYKDGKILVVVSKSLVTVWKEELTKFFDNKLDYEILHKDFGKLNVTNIGESKSKDSGSKEWHPKAKLIITTPETISKIYTKYNVGSFYTFTARNGFGPETRYYNIPTSPYLTHKTGDGLLYSIKWGAVIVDEGHNYMNPTSARCLAISSLSAHHRWILSGTLLAEPKPERIMGYYLMLNDDNFPRNLPAFRLHIKHREFRGISTTLVRRDTNVDFVPPSINRIIVSHALTQTEGLIYTNVKGLLNTLKKKLDIYKARGDTVNIKKFSSYILGMISYLRQCLVCPLIPITTVALTVADFEQKNDLAAMFLKYIDDMGINDWLNDIESLRSSRIKSVCKHVKKHPKERVIVFSCYRTCLDVLRLYLPKDRDLFTISGIDKINKRNQTIENFRESKDGILLLTYDIGANGLNLQCSSVVLLVDFWWDAAKSEQAIARILRPGQESEKVTIYYFTANTGMENALFKLQQSKITVGRELLEGCCISDVSKIKISDILKLLNTEDNIGILKSMNSNNSIIDEKCPFENVELPSCADEDSS